MKKITLLFFVLIFGMANSFGQGDCDLDSSTPDPSGGINVWNRPLESGTSLSAVGIGVSYHVYGPFTVDVTGSYTFSSSQTGFDGFIFIYQNEFNPSTPLVNFVAGDDDAVATNTSLITTNLTAGTTYFFITTGFDPTDFGNFTTTVNGAGTITCTQLGVSLFDDNRFAYFPNPVKNALNLSYSQEISNVEVFNLLGQKMTSNKMNSNSGQIDMSSLTAGSYMVKVTAGNQSKTVKIIKQ